MKSNIGYLKYVFIGLFVIASGSFTIYDLMYRIPRQKCEAGGDWWSDKYRQCTIPFRIVDMPGYKRVLPLPASASASASK